jgi:hypothetical protein
MLCPKALHSKDMQPQLFVVLQPFTIDAEVIIKSFNI